MIKIRLCEFAVSRILSICLTAEFTAVSKPIVSFVPYTSLSIVPGIPMNGMLVCFDNKFAAANEPLPPITKNASMSFNFIFSAACSNPS